MHELRSVGRKTSTMSIYVYEESENSARVSGEGKKSHRPQGTSRRELVKLGEGIEVFLTSSAFSVITPSLLSVNAPKSSLGIFFFFFFLNRESPVVKGNALLALSSLAVVVSRHEASLSSDSEGVPEVS